MFKAILQFFQTTTPSCVVPQPFGAFHLTFLALSILAAVLLSVFFRNSSDETYRKIVLICWIIFLVIEVYKQITYNFHIQPDGSIKFEYQWYVFPFQFCSSPFYVLPFIAFSKNKHVYDACTAFAMTFMLFAGLAVIALGSDIYEYRIGINIQTSIHHGMMLALGVLTLVRNRKRYGDYKFFLKGCVVFAILLVVAIVLNSLAPLWTNATFNMFFLAEKWGCHIPVLSLIQPHVPHFVFIFIYFVGFSFVALIVHSVARVIYALVNAIKR